MTDERRRRTWSVDEKRQIVAQTRVPGISVSQVARRYDVNANLIFKWLRDPRFCTTVQPDPDAPTFLPVEVSETLPVAAPERVRCAIPDKIKIALANGYHLEINGKFDVAAVVRLARGLAT